MESFDVVVIGAGWYGLAAAKTYHQVNPTHRLLILDSASSVGGVWAQHRLYPGLKSNNMLGTLEYPDFPMDPATYGVQPGQHIPGPVLHRYLTHYAQHFGIFDHIRFETTVEAAERQEGPEGGWILTTVPTDGHAPATRLLRTARLVVATGLTSEPYVPAIPGREDYRGLLFHSKDFRQHAATTLTDGTSQPSSVAVVGSSKSAWDVAYAYATADPPIPVDLIVRTSGRGPVWMAPAYVTPFKRWLEELVHTPLLTLFSPCPWADEGGYASARYLLHRTWLGRRLVDAFWWVLGADVLGAVGYDAHPKTAKLKPWTSPFWIGSGLGILNFDQDFLALVREGRIRVHLADITRLSAEAVHLANGETVPAPVLCLATGWKSHPPLTFSGPSASSAALGLPFAAPATSPEARRLTTLLASADAEILTRFPRLRRQPARLAHYRPDAAPQEREDGDSDHTAFFAPRLARFLVPPASLANHAPRDIAFPGLLTSISTAPVAHAQALWLCAYFAGSLCSVRRPPSAEAAEREALLWTRFGRWRYVAGYGGRVPDFVFDAVAYVACLGRDVGVLGPAGKVTGGLMRPLRPGGLRGWVDGWMERVDMERGGKV